MKAAGELDVKTLYEEHGDFVWKSLTRLGVQPSDLRDMTQEVFIVVHRQLSSFRGQSSVTTWLFEICRRVASAYRRRAHRKHEDVVSETPEPLDLAPPASPEEAASAKQAQARLEAILSKLDINQRAVFVMYEIDQMTCQEIAGVVGCPLGTVYSRLRLARQAFEAELKRLEARDAHGERRS